MKNFTFITFVFYKKKHMVFGDDLRFNKTPKFKKKCKSIKRVLMENS